VKRIFRSLELTALLLFCFFNPDDTALFLSPLIPVVMLALGNPAKTLESSSWFVFQVNGRLAVIFFPLLLILSDPPTNGRVNRTLSRFFTRNTSSLWFVPQTFSPFSCPSPPLKSADSVPNFTILLSFFYHQSRFPLHNYPFPSKTFSIQFSPPPLSFSPVLRVANMDVLPLFLFFVG